MSHMDTETEIRSTFTRMCTPLARQGMFGDARWYPQSQYGIDMFGPCSSKEEAEQKTLDYYSARMHLIRQ